MLGLAWILGLTLAAIVVSVWIGTAWMLTHPPRRTYAWAVSRGLPGDPGEMSPSRAFEAWKLKSRGVDLAVWEIRGEHPHGPTVIVSHGWGDSRVGGLCRLPAIAKYASRVVMWDLPGHGESGGTSSLGTREVEDLAELLWAVDGRAGNSHRLRGGLFEGRVVLYGWSLGAGVSIALAGREEFKSVVAGVIAETPYRHAQRVAANVLRARGLPWRWNAPVVFAWLGARFGVGRRWAGFDRAELATRLSCPLLVIHGDRDQVSDVEHGREIAARGRGRLELIEEGGHNDLWLREPFAGRCAAAVGAFIESLHDRGEPQR